MCVLAATCLIDVDQIKGHILVCTIMVTQNLPCLYACMVVKCGQSAQSCFHVGKFISYIHCTLPISVPNMWTKVQ